MTSERFQYLKKLTNVTTRLCEPISVEKRLLLKLHFLASGESQLSLTKSFHLGKATVSKVILEICLPSMNHYKKFI